MNSVLESNLTKAQREDRVLILLHLLGGEAAEEVLERLDPSTNTLLRNRLKDFSQRPPPVRRQQQVLDEFDRFFQFALTTARPALRIHDGEADVDGDEARPAQPIYELSGDPLIDLEKMNMFQLARSLEDEQPRTVALLLKVVTAKRVAQLLNLLSESKKEAVVREMSRDPRAPEIILRRIASTTVERAASLPAEPQAKNDPVQRMVDVLRATEKTKRRQILKALEEQDPEQAQLVNNSLYQFEDLLLLEDSQIQKVLSKIDSATLSTALYGAEDEIVDKIMRSLSKRARASLQEEISFRRNVNGAQLRAARHQVVQAIGEAEQEAE
jgi:flagellar motor switch protein FliG